MAQDVSNEAIQIATERQKRQEDIELCVFNNVCPYDATDLILVSSFMNTNIYKCVNCECEFKVTLKGGIKWIEEML